MRELQKIDMMATVGQFEKRVTILREISNLYSPRALSSRAAASSRRDARDHQSDESDRSAEAICTTLHGTPQTND